MENFDFSKIEDQKKFNELDSREKVDIIDDSLYEAKLMNEKYDFAQNTSAEKKEELRELSNNIFPHVQNISDEDLYLVDMVLKRAERWKGAVLENEQYKSNKDLDYEIGSYFLSAASVSNGSYNKNSDYEELSKIYLHLFDSAKNNINFVALMQWPYFKEYNPNMTSLDYVGSLRRNAVTMAVKLLYGTKDEPVLKIKDISNEEINMASKFILEIFHLRPYKDFTSSDPQATLDEYLKNEYGIEYDDLGKLFEVYKESRSEEDFKNKIQNNLDEAATKQKREFEKRRLYLKNGGLEEIVGKVRDDRIPTGFINNYDEIIKNQKNKEFFERVLAGKPVIDLGCGPLPDNVIIFAKKCGASKYVAIEKYNIDELRQNCSGDKFIEIINSDMLKFVFDQEEESANISMNGIDDSIFDIDKGKNKEYVEILIGEIARVVPKGGIAFGYNSPFLGLLSKFGFKKVDLGEKRDFANLNVWQKPS